MPEKTDLNVIDTTARVADKPGLTPDQLRAAAVVARANAEREMARLRRVPAPARPSERPR
jgi:hypothetical protein